MSIYLLNLKLDLDYIVYEKYCLRFISHYSPFLQIRHDNILDDKTEKFQNHTLKSNNNKLITC